MKVLILSTVFPNGVQPLHGVFIRERLRHITSLAAVQVIAPVPWFRKRPAIPREERQGDLVVAHPTFFYVPATLKVLDGLFLFLSSLGAAARLRRTFRFDLIEAHWTYPEGVAAVLLGRWFRRPVVITMHGSEMQFAKQRLRRAAISWALRRANQVIAVSTPLAQLAVTLGVPPTRLQVISNGVDTQRFLPEPRDDAYARIGLTPQGPLLVAVGHLVPLKGFHRMIAAFEALKEQFPGIRLAIIGGPAPSSGRYPQQLASLVERQHLQGQVLLTGAQAPERVVHWLNAADLLVLASDREGSPNVVFEAMACGCPVVASSVGEIEHMVPAHAGRLYSPPDDVEELTRCLGEALRATWDRAAIRASAERNTWTAVAEKVVEVWEDAAEPATEAALVH